MGSKLRPKYTVQKVKCFDSPGSPFEQASKPMLSTVPDDVNSPFVLMPRKDPAAFLAMLTYAQYCEQGLANEIRGWLNLIAEAVPVYGSQGKKNFTHMWRNIISRTAQE